MLEANCSGSHLREHRNSEAPQIGNRFLLRFHFVAVIFRNTHTHIHTHIHAKKKKNCSSMHGSMELVEKTEGIASYCTTMHYELRSYSLCFFCFLYFKLLCKSTRHTMHLAIDAMLLFILTYSRRRRRLRRRCHCFSIEL